MKVSRILKIGALALLASSLVFVACKKEDDDDDYGIISKDDSDNFTINYTNSESSVNRGYKTTRLKHSGALTQITMNKVSASSGAMGYIWDLESADKDGNYSRAAKDTRRFLIAGFNCAQSGNSYFVNPYVSLYKDVLDIQANNFGVAGTTKKETEEATKVGDATETEYLKLGSKSLSVTPDSTTGDFVITLDVYESGKWDWNENKTKRVYTSYDGGYNVDIYVGALTTKEVAEKNTPDAEATIPAKDLGYLEALQEKYANDANKLAKITEDNIVKQQSCAAYANVYAGKTLKGSIKYADTYSADEVVEE